MVSTDSKDLLAAKKLSYRFQQALSDVSAQFQIKRWVIALSGGLDSCVLLDLLAAAKPSLPVKVIHVHHGLSPNADQWLAFCQSLSDRYGVEWHGQKVQLADGSIEQQARVARYQVFQDTLVEGDVLLMAHHLNDQAETFFQRLLRGSGMRGLSSIPAFRSFDKGMLFRPLLDEPRAELENYAVSYALSWVEDESNSSARYDRNYLRHKVLPLLQSRWPKALDAIARTQQTIQKDAQALAFYRDNWLKQHDSMDRFNIEALQGVPDDERLGLLSAWVKRHVQYSLSAEQLAHLLSDIVLAQQDAQPVMDIGAFELRRHHHHIHCIAKTSVDYPVFRAELDLQVFNPVSVDLPDGSCLKLLPDPEGYVFEDTKLEVRYRQGGEKIKPIADAHTRDLKKWFQMNDIPAWQRSKIPLLYCNQKLVAVADLCVAQCCATTEVELSEQSKSRWRIEWCNAVAVK